MVGQQSSPLEGMAVGGSSSDRWTPVDLCLKGTQCPLCSQHRENFSLGTSQRCHLTSLAGLWLLCKMLTWRGLIGIKRQVLPKGQKMNETLEPETAMSDVSP